MIDNLILRQAISRVLISGVLGKPDAPVEELILLPDAELTDSIQRIADHIQRIKYTLADNTTRITGIENETFDANEIGYVDPISGDISTVQDAIYRLLLANREFRQVVSGEIGSLKRGLIDVNTELGRISSQPLLATNVIYGDTDAASIIGFVQTEIEEIKRKIIEYTDWINEVEAFRPSADEVSYNAGLADGSTTVQAAIQKLVADSRNNRQSILDELGSIRQTYADLTFKLAEILRKPNEADTTTYLETTVAVALTDLISETGTIWTDINSLIERTRALETATLNAKGIVYNDATHFGLRSIEDAINKLFALNGDLQTLFQQSVEKINHTANHVVMQPKRWGTLEDNVPLGLKNTIYHDGAALVGDDQTETQGAIFEVIGNSSSGAGNHKLTGKNAAILAGSENQVTGNNALSGGHNNQANGDNGSVLGGYNNVAGAANSGVLAGFNHSINGPSAAIAGGEGNKIDQPRGFIGGGEKNHLGMPNAFIGAGVSNEVIGESSVVGGGRNNTVMGDYAIIPGGIENLAKGYASVALGIRALARHDGTFIWHCADQAYWPSLVKNEFALSAAGGYRLRTSLEHKTGVDLPAGGNAWIMGCPAIDQADVEDVDGLAVLSALATVPVRRYQQSLLKRIPISGELAEIGLNPLIQFLPTAEDWDTAFAEILSVNTLKNADESGNLQEIPGISQGDFLGVLMKSVQALYQIVLTQADQNTQLMERVTQLEAK